MLVQNSCVTILRDLRCIDSSSHNFRVEKPPPARKSRNVKRRRCNRRDCFSLQRSFLHKFQAFFDNSSRMIGQIDHAEMQRMWSGQKWRQSNSLDGFRGFRNFLRWSSIVTWLLMFIFYHYSNFPPRWTFYQFIKMQRKNSRDRPEALKKICTIQ